MLLSLVLVLLFVPGCLSWVLPSDCTMLLRCPGVHHQHHLSCRALLTRNIKAAVDHFHAHHFPLPPFQPALSRECHVHKPNPDALLFCCEEWGVAPHEVAIVGDSAKDDVRCKKKGRVWLVCMWHHVMMSLCPGVTSRSIGCVWQPCRGVDHFARLLRQAPRGRVGTGGRAAPNVQGGWAGVEGVVMLFYRWTPLRSCCSCWRHGFSCKGWRRARR